MYDVRVHFIYLNGPFLRGVFGLSTCSHCGTVSSVTYAWSLDSLCKKVSAGKYSDGMDF